MNDNLTYIKENSIYPGGYTPLPEVEALLEELKKPDKDITTKPLVNMNESKDCFRLEVVVPGVKRENIFINLHENILSIAVLHKKEELKNEKLQIHEFDTLCFERHILIPDKADIEFVSAQYKEGILSLYIPKTQQPSTLSVKQIITY